MAGALFSDAAGRIAVLTKSTRNAMIGFVVGLRRVLAGVGLKTDFRELKKQGLRPFVVGALAELFITAVTLGLVVGAAAVFRL